MSAAPAPGFETSPISGVVVGVDTHKQTHMAVALGANGGWMGSLKLDAQRSGYQELMRWAGEFGCNPAWCQLHRRARPPNRRRTGRCQGWTDDMVRQRGWAPEVA